jgi:hypothetical protein
MAQRVSCHHFVIDVAHRAVILNGWFNKWLLMLSSVDSQFDFMLGTDLAVICFMSASL